MGRRVIGVTETLPEYATRGDRIARIGSDIRAATAKGRARCVDNIRAQGYAERGYVVDEESWETALIGVSRVMVTVRIERPE